MKIISFSGLDGSGKGTQIEILEEYLKLKSIKYQKIWARGSWTPGIELIKKVIRRDQGFTEEQKNEYRIKFRSNPKKQIIIVILSLCDLIWYWGIYYRFLALCGNLIICDRYIWDTYVDFKINFSKINIDNWFLWKFLVVISPKPNPSFVFEITAEESIRRGLLKEEAHMETLEIKNRKVTEYKKLIELGKWAHPIDANLNIELIHNIIVKNLNYEN